MMKVTKPSHKVYLAGLFYEGGQERKFQLAQVASASSALRKLFAGSTSLEDGAGLRFDDSEVTFAIDEAKLLKDLLDGVRSASVSEYAVYSELKQIFQ